MKIRFLGQTFDVEGVELRRDAVEVPGPADGFRRFEPAPDSYLTFRPAIDLPIGTGIVSLVLENGEEMPINGDGTTWWTSSGGSTLERHEGFNRRS